MVNANPVLSIVIPTHNRSKYAISSVRSLLDITSEDFEVVIHDTSNDERELEQWIKQQNDSRLNYVHWSTHLSMSENHERAVKLAKGEYICLIGDDDSVSCNIIKLAEMCRESDIDLLTPKIKASYSWPDFTTKYYGNAHGSKVYLGKYNCEIEAFDVKERLEVTLSQGCQGTDYLPKLYHGLVRRSLLDMLRDKHGRVFFGASPDISVSLGLSILSKKYYMIDFPFTLPGASGGSNTGRSAMKKHKGSIEDEPHLKPYEELVWPKWLPQFFSVETLWALSAWDTLKKSGNEKLLEKYNYSRVYALCFLYHKDYYKQIITSLNYSINNKYPRVSYMNIAKDVVYIVIRDISRKAKRLMRPGASNGKQIVASVENIRMARTALDQCLCGKPNKFNFNIKLLK